MWNDELLLSAEKVSKVFTRKDGSQFTACNEVSLCLHRGETLGLVGELVSLISHRVVVMQQGSIVEELPGDKLAACQHPYTKKLLNSVFKVNK